MPKFHFRVILARVRSSYRKAVFRRVKVPPFPGEWSVMLIDSAPIRKKAKKDYERILRDLDVAREEVEKFEKEDRPKYQQWLSHHFGASLTELRELDHKLIEVEGLVQEVQQEFYFGNYRSIYKAYERVRQRRENPEEEPAEEHSESREQEQEEDPFRKFFEELFSEEELADAFAKDQHPRKEPKPTLNQIHRENRIKDLYRTLVRRLHPDHAENLTPKHVEWWHQTQNAYEGGNLEQLELIFTLTEIDKGGTKEASISILKKITLQFKQTLRSIKDQLKAFKRDPAWNFSILQDYSSLFTQTRLMLEREKARLLWMTEKYKEQIKSWEQSRRPRKRVRVAGNGWEDEEWF